MVISRLLQGSANVKFFLVQFLKSCFFQFSKLFKKKTSFSKFYSSQKNMRSPIPAVWFGYRLCVCFFGLDTKNAFEAGCIGCGVYSFFLLSSLPDTQAG